jgi:hypothetical protein
MRAIILASAVGLVLTASAQAAPLGPTPIPAANVVTVQGWPNWQWAGKVDQARARTTSVASTVGGYGTKSTRSASAYLTLHPGSGPGWSITSGKLESSSEASVGAFSETASSFACFGTLPLSSALSLLACALQHPIADSSWPWALIYRRGGEL